MPQTYKVTAISPQSFQVEDGYYYIKDGFTRLFDRNPSLGMFAPDGNRDCVITFFDKKIAGIFWGYLQGYRARGDIINMNDSSSRTPREISAATIMEAVGTIINIDIEHKRSSEPGNFFS